MGYSIDSLPLSSFVVKNIDMPRFQRGIKWNNTQKMELAISIFKKYPLGSVIFCIEKQNKQVVNNYLIDGRQRYTVVKEIFERPDVMFTWAKSYLNLSKEPDLAKAFWKKVSEYTNYDKNETSDNQDDTDEIIDSNEDFPDNDDGSTNTELNDDNLKLLLSLLQLCKDGDTYNNGLTKLFDFKTYISNTSKFERRLIDLNLANKRKIDCFGLKSFLYSYIQECQRDGGNYKDKDRFISFIDQEYSFLSPQKKNKCINELFGEWEDKQLKVFDLFKQIDTLLENSKIATIVVEDVPANDEQKIFNVINTNGTPLTAAEVLSAKPCWNSPISRGEVSTEVIDKINELYKIVLNNEEAPSRGLVKWDLPASLLLSLNNFDFLFPVKQYLQKYRDKKDDKQAKIITLGFKIISGYVLGKIKKNDLAELGDNSFIEPHSLNDLRNKINKMVLTVNEMPYFKVFSSWNLSLSSLIGDTPTLYFLLCSLYMFERYGEPTPTANDRQARLFTKNCFILIDSIIYDYVNSIWKGSSDSLLESKYISFKRNFNPNNVISYIDKDNWTKIIDDIIDDSKIKTKDISMSIIKPLVSHYYCLKGLKNRLTQDFVTEFDHIIPQERFSESTEASRDKINMNSLYNLGLLPKTSNASKSNKVLTDLLSNHVLTANVNDYEEIPTDKFSEFSSSSSLSSLKNFRGEFIKKEFGDNRETKWING